MVVTPLFEGLARPAPAGEICPRCGRGADLEVEGRLRCVTCHVDGLQTPPRPGPEPPEPRRPVRAERVPVVPARRGGTVVWRGQAVSLSATRYRLVVYLRAHPGFRRPDDLAMHLWRAVDYGTRNAIAPGLIESRPGFGYRLAAGASQST